MIDFEHIHLFWALLLSPIIYRMAKKQQQQLAKKLGLWQSTLDNEQLAEEHKNKNLSLLFAMGAFVFIIIALANPRLGLKEETATQKARDVYIAIDISKSMDATDTPPSRLEVVKKKASAFVEAIKGNRIGVLFFAGTSYLAMPLTTDYRAAITLIEACNTDQAGVQGTDISGVAETVLTANKRLGKGVAELVIFTDGEDQEEGVSGSIQKLADQGITVYLIGVGTKNGGTIMEAEGLMTDDEGNVVHTRLNEALLKEMAAAGNGAYYNITDSEWINQLTKETEQKAVGKDSIKKIKRPKSYAYIPLLIALMFVLFLAFPFSGLSLPSARNKKLWICLFSLTTTLSIGQNNPKFGEGNQYYKKGAYKEAEEKYRQGLEETDNATARYNRGNSQYKMGDTEAAIKSYQSAQGALKNKEQQYKLHHNLGNSYFKLGQMDQAIDHYKAALRIQPGSEATAINLAKAKQQQQQQQKSKSEDQKADEDKKEEKGKEEKKEEKKDQGKSQQEEKKEKGNSSEKKQDPQKKDQENGNWTEEKAMLDFLEREEKKVQEQLRRTEGKAKKPKKPW